MCRDSYNHKVYIDKSSEYNKMIKDWKAIKGKGLSGYFLNKKNDDRAVYLNKIGNGRFQVIHQSGNYERFLTRSASKPIALKIAKEYMRKNK